MFISRFLNHYGKYHSLFKHSSFKSLKDHWAKQLTHQLQVALNFKKTEIKDPLPYKFLRIIQEVVGIDLKAKFKSEIQGLAIIKTLTCLKI